MTTLAPSFLIGSSLFLQVKRTTIKFRIGSKFGKIPPGTEELGALEGLEKSPLTYDGKGVVTTLVPSFLNGSSSFLHVTRTTMKAWTSLNFGKIPSQTTKLAALEHLKNQYMML